MKIVFLALFLAMIIALGFGLFYLLKSPSEDDKGDKVIKALTWRISIWVVLLAVIVLSMKLGWIQPSNSVHPINFQNERQRNVEENR